MKLYPHCIYNSYCIRRMYGRVRPGPVCPVCCICVHISVVIHIVHMSLLLSRVVLFIQLTQIIHREPPIL